MHTYICIYLYISGYPDCDLRRCRRSRAFWTPTQAAPLQTWLKRIGLNGSAKKRNRCRVHCLFIVVCVCANARAHFGHLPNNNAKTVERKRDQGIGLNGSVITESFPCPLSVHCRLSRCKRSRAFRILTRADLLRTSSSASLKHEPPPTRFSRHAPTDRLQDSS